MSRTKERPSKINIPVVPKQARAKATYEKILQAGQAILQESGLAALNSNAIVARAGVTAPVFYRYFKNKEALLITLGQRLTDAQNEVYLEALDRLEAGGDQLAFIHTLLKDTLEVTERFQGAYALLVSLRATPSASAIRLEANTQMALIGAKRLRPIMPDLSVAEAMIRNRVAVEMGYSIVEMLMEDPSINREAALKETAFAIHALLMR